MNQATSPEARTYMVCVEANEGRIVAQVTRTIEYGILPRTIDGKSCDPDVNLCDDTVVALMDRMDAECDRMDEIEADLGAERADIEAKAARLRQLTRRPMTKTELEYSGPYLYAQRNGYVGTLADYVTSQYAAYASTCSCNGICPMSRAMWEAK